MKASVAVPVILGSLLVGGGLAFAAGGKKKKAGVPIMETAEDEAPGEVLAADEDLAAMSEAAGPGGIVVADENDNLTVLSPSDVAEAAPLPTDDEMEDSRAAAELEGLAESEMDVEDIDAAADELDAHAGDEDAELTQEVEEQERGAPTASPVAPVGEVFPEPQAPVVTQAPVQVPQAPVVTQAPVQVPQAPVVTQAPVQVPQAPVVTQAPVQVPQAPTFTAQQNEQRMFAAFLLRLEQLDNWKPAGQAEIKAWQARNGLTADGLFGPGSALKLAGDVGVAPIVRYWPKAWIKGGQKFQEYLAALEAIGVDPSREKGQGFGTPPGRITEYAEI